MIKFITTFSQNGYNLYGKNWIEKFIENTNSPDITADIYVDFPITTNCDRINILDFDTEVPEWKIWSSKFKLRSRHQDYAKTGCLKFSFKAFVMAKALKKATKGYVIWLDGDAMITNNDFDGFPQNIMNGNFAAVQREYTGSTVHCESGIVVFDAENKEKELFADNLLNEYLDFMNLMSVAEPFDGYMIWRALIKSNISNTDLNDGFGRGGIQSDPNHTFLNPEINKRFKHNIGVTGKQQYANWESIWRTDDFFKLAVEVVRSIRPRTQQEIKRVEDKKSKFLSRRTK